MRLQKTITPLLWRVIVFFCLFVFISGVTGPRIIASDILFRDGFALYGSIGKALLFGLIAFVLLARHNKPEVILRPWRPALLGWMLLSVLFLALSWVNVNRLLGDEREFQTLALAHGGLLLSLASAAIGCIGPQNIRLLWRSYRREIINSVAIAVLFYGFLLLVYALWQPLASFVLWGVNGLLGLSGLHATIIPPNTLLFDKFGITVAEYCSGVESIALFTGLYVIVGLLDWRRIHKKRYFAIFPLALIILCLFNVVRVYGLIMAGYHINPEIAFSLFHTYAGMVFFVVFSAAFWAVAYKYLIEQPRGRHENPAGH
jgi:exosortase/archaeosortase family protein